VITREKCRKWSRSWWLPCVVNAWPKILGACLNVIAYIAQNQLWGKYEDGMCTHYTYFVVQWISCRKIETMDKTALSC